MITVASRFGNPWRPFAWAVCALIGLAGCGQRGPLYMPDKNARVVTRPAANSSAPAEASAPVSTPR